MKLVMWMKWTVCLGACVLGFAIAQSAHAAPGPAVVDGLLTNSVTYCQTFNCVNPAQNLSIPDPGDSLDECENGPWLLDVSVQVCGAEGNTLAVACSVNGSNFGGFPSIFFLTHQGSNLWTFTECISEYQVTHGFRITGISCSALASGAAVGIEQVCLRYQCNDCED